MNVLVFASEQEAASTCAKRVSAAVRDKPELVLGLPTGRTPLPVYREMGALHARGELDLSQVTAFGLDEFLGLAPGDEGSHRAYLERHLLSQVNLARERTYGFDGSAERAERECARYDALLASEGGLDLLLLGIGSNGHVALNEPGESLQAASHRERLTRETRQGLSPLFGGGAERVPLAALTLGMGPLLQARRVVVLAFGVNKAAAVTAMVRGPITPHCPASFLQLHRDVEVWLDPAAASGLS